MEKVRETGELVFETSLGGTRIVRIPNPVANATPLLVSTAANRIIAANPFDETVGNLVALMRADRVIVQRIVLLPVSQD